MNNLPLNLRANLYHDAFPKFPPLTVVNGARIEGLWIMGNCYQTSGYYGAYPHGYLDRVMAMFPDADPARTMHLFAGSLPPGPYVRVDSRAETKPDILADAHELAAEIEVADAFELILADPPYSAEDAEHYGCPMVKRRVVLEQCRQILRPGGWVVWLDQVLPMFRKTDWDWAMAIGMVKSTNHRVRGVFGFRKVAA